MKTVSMKILSDLIRKHRSKFLAKCVGHLSYTIDGTCPILPSSCEELQKREKDNIKISDEVSDVMERFWREVIIEMILNKLNSLIGSSLLK